MTDKTRKRLLVATALVLVLAGGVFVMRMSAVEPVLPTSANANDAAAIDEGDAAGSTKPLILVNEERYDEAIGNPDCTPADGAAEKKDWPLSAYDSESEFNEANAEVVARLESTGNPEHLMAAAMIGYSAPRGDDRVGRFIVAHRADPSDPVILNALVQVCTQGGFVAKNCDLKVLQQRLIEIDGTNSETWAIIGGQSVPDGDYDTALNELRRAAAAPVTNGYYAERVGIIQRALATTGFGDSAQQSFMALIHGDFVGLSRNMLLGACNRHQKDDSEWNASCLAYGKKLEHESRTVADRVYGIVLQDYALQSQESPDDIADVKRRLKETFKYLHGAPSGDFDSTFSSDPTMLAEYIDILNSHGQFEANRRYSEMEEAWRAKHCSQVDTDRASPGAIQE